jgi:hypothetical protein
MDRYLNSIHFSRPLPVFRYVHFSVLIVFYISVQVMTEPDPGGANPDVLAIYRQEGLREQDGSTPPPLPPPLHGSSSSSSPPLGAVTHSNVSSMETDNLRDPTLALRLQEYIARHKKQKNNSTTPDSGSSSSLQCDSNNDNSVIGTDNIANAIRTIRYKMLDAPGLIGGARSISGAINSSGPNGGAWSRSTYFEKKDFGRKKLISLSFDPTTFKCN